MKKIAPINTNQTTALGLSGLSNALWLVKIPKFVSEKWSNTKDGELVGTLSSSSVKDPSTNQIIKKLNVSMPLEEEAVSSVSNSGDSLQKIEFTLDEIGSTLSKSNDLLAFVHDPGSNAYSLVGRCTKSLILKPKDDAQYHVIRKRRLIAETSRKESQHMDHSEMTSRPLSSAAFIINLDNSNGNSLNMSRKKTKIDVDVNIVRGRIFSEFAKEDKVLLNDVLAACKDIPGASADSVRPILEMYATFHKKGQFHSYWELKPEYRDNSNIKN